MTIKNNKREVARAIDAVKSILNHYGPVMAEDVCVHLMLRNVIGTQDYMYLARWCRGRDTRSTIEWVEGWPQS